MPKTKQSAKKPTTKQTKSKPPRPKPRRNVNRDSALIRSVCSLNDPFCAHALGARGNDGSKTRSLAIPYHSRFTLTTDGNGSATCLFLPAYDTVVASPTSIVADTATFTTAMGVTSPMLNVSAYRIITAGVIVRYIGAPLNATGMVRIRNFNATLGGQLSSINMSTYQCDEYMDVAAASAREIAVNFKKSDQARAVEFNEPNVTTPTDLPSSWVGNGWSPTIISITGGVPTSTLLDIEVFFNYEVTFDDSTTNAILAQPSPKFNSTLETVSNIVSSETKSFVKEGILAFSQRMLDRAVKQAAGALANRVGMTMILP